MCRCFWSSVQSSMTDHRNLCYNCHFSYFISNWLGEQRGSFFKQGWGRLQRHDYDYDYTMITETDYDYNYGQKMLIMITITKP